MVLYTKCIKAPISPEDGCRISIMNRHTLNDGLTIDTEITPSLYDLHEKAFAPPDKLLGNYYKRGLPWEEFVKKYLAHIKQVKSKIESLGKMALSQNITLLCIEQTAEKCHRRLLAEECKTLTPELEVIIL